jgi:hypothetical protein
MIGANLEMKGKRLLVSVFVCAAACKGSTPTPIAKPRVESVASPATTQLAAWLTAFNSGDRATLLAYHQRAFAYEVASHDVSDIDRELGLSEGTGGFVLKNSETPASTSVVAIVKERHSEQFAQVKMEVDAVEPHRVTRFEIHPIPTPDEFSTPDERKARLVDDARRRAVIDGIARELQAYYIFPDVATRMIAAVRDHLAHGDYNKIARGDEFAQALTKDLRDVSHDLHLGVLFGHPPQRRGGAPEDMHAALRAMNYGFGAIERMPGNVAHVVIDGFPGIPDDARDGVADLMSQVADADALIVDLRHNHGGSPETVALVASYLFDTPTHLNDMYSRDTGATTPSWTLRDLKGARFGGTKPVYVLTSKETFSGGEELAYDLQALRRAKTVGEPTGGGAHPVGAHELDASFTILVPSGRPINPVTKTDWEGVGVKPDIPVAADAALEEAHRRAAADIAKRKRQP